MAGNWSISALLKHIYEIEDIYKNISCNTCVEDDENYFSDLELNIELRVCNDCGRNVDKIGFKTADERREFTISGLCSDCQRKYFGK